MRRVLGGLGVLLRKTYARFNEHEGPRIAGSISFFVLFSATPSIALLVISIGWAIHDTHEQAHLLGHMLEVLPVGSTQNRAFLLKAVGAVKDASAGLSVLGIIGMMWSTLGMFSAARWGLDRALGIRARRSFAGVRLRDIAVAMGIWLLLLLSAVGTAAIHVAMGHSEIPAGSLPGGPDPAWATVQWTMPALLSFGAFLFLYWYVPDVSSRFRDVVPAAILATLLFELSKYAFGLYVSVISSHSPLYGVLGGILGFMLWVYVCSSILLLGAEFAWVYRHRRAASL
jgi:membrane protein